MEVVKTSVHELVDDKCAVDLVSKVSVIATGGLALVIGAWSVLCVASAFASTDNLLSSLVTAITG